MWRFGRISLAKPSNKDAYNVIYREESCKGISASSGGTESKQNATSFVAKTFNNNNKQFNNNGNNFTRGTSSNVNRGPNPNLNCKHYGKIGHTIDRCFEIVGFPQGFKIIFTSNSNNGKQSFNVNSDVKMSDKSFYTSFPSGFTSKQIQKLLNRINDKSSGSIHDNMESRASFFNGNFWANQHLTGSTSGMSNVVDIYDLKITIGHPNGTLAVISHVGNLKLTNNVMLYDVLGYYVSLLSMNKLIRDSKIFVGFDENTCYILDLKMVKILRTDSKSGGLYLFDVNKSYCTVNYLNVPMMMEEIHLMRKVVCLTLILMILHMTPVLRRFKRQSKLPVRLNDYVLRSNVTYGVKKYMNYTKLSRVNMCFATSLNKYVETTCLSKALSGHNWVEAMNNEIEALNMNNTWTICDLPIGRKPIGSKWLWKIKYKASGDIERYKARIVAKGYSQREGFDYDETFSLVIKMVIVRCLIALALVNNWHLFQLDVNNAFLYGDVLEDVYMDFPDGYNNESNTKVCKLNKSLYGLKQALRQWNAKLTTTLAEHGFEQTKFDYSLYNKHNGDKFIALLVYVDAIVITEYDNVGINDFKVFLSTKFMIKYLGVLKYFLGIEVVENDFGLCMSQRKYYLELLHEYGLLAARPVDIPLPENSILGFEETSNDKYLADFTSYQKLVGKLIYLINTRPDISYVVHCLSQHMHSPLQSHFKAALRVLRYLKGSPGCGVQFYKNFDLKLKAYADANWAKCPKTRSLGLRNLYLVELFCGKSSTIQIAANHVFHERTKHFELDVHFVREKVLVGIIKTVNISSDLQTADVLTKCLGVVQHRLCYKNHGVLDVFAGDLVGKDSGRKEHAVEKKRKNEDVEEDGDLSLEAIEDDEVALVDGAFEGAFGALRDEWWCVDGLEVEALVNAMEPLTGSIKVFWSEEMIEYYEGVCEDIRNDKINGHFDDKCKENEVKSLISDNRISLFAIIESQLRKKSVTPVCNALFGSWSWVSNTVDSRKGCRIIVGWDPFMLRAWPILQIDQVMHFEWKNLVDHKILVGNSPMVLLGDFNVLLSFDESSNCFNTRDKRMVDFKECVKDLEIKDINSYGMFYTWIEKRKNHDLGIFKKLDRVMGNGNFVSTFERSYTNFLPYLTTDHCHVILAFHEVNNFKPKSFSFLNFLADKDNFIPTIKENWNFEVKGFAMFVLAKRLKNMKLHMRRLNKHNGNVLDKDPHNALLREEEMVYSRAYTNDVLDEEKLLNQKTKIEWLRKGDHNTAYFHNVLKGWVSKSRIKVVTDDAGNTFYGGDIPAKPVMDEEIRAAMFDIKDDKAEGLDGLVDINHCALIPGRHISDNILLTQDLMVGYDWKSGTSNCAFKVDIKKARGLDEFSM
nr:ribonuclease H-like domain-containing protein [Tanacetum cinerariifolium]